MRRVALIGNGGGGKSTLARALGLHLRIPVHEVDQIQWLPGWRRAPLDEVARTLEAWAADDSWIIDGFGPWPVIDRRMGRADTIVYVDFPLRTHLWWAAKRQVVSFVRRRAWGGQSAPPSSLLLFRTLRRVHAMRADLLELVTKDGRQRKLVHLRSPREMARWLNDVTRTTAVVAD
ncbi:MAG TPA: flagellar protein FlaR [Candidatus Bathyarchaeia archaeon]|nr:flagellar protein FlaR [Candidatus Bathyarchaeia archaeon]